MNIKCNVLDRQYKMYENEYNEAVLKVLSSGWYVLGKQVENFEEKFAEFIGSKYCVGLNSGLDSLTLAIKALNIGKEDEVIVPANTYIATVLAITNNGATPIFVEPDEFYNIDVSKIEDSITKKTKAILCVHLYGQSCNMSRIVEITNKYNLYLVEDCAQSHGSKFNGKMTGSFGDIGCFSFYPTKNLGAFGDGGAITTDNKDIYEKIKMLRNYGSKVKYYNEVEGVNSRLDEIQAALLSVKLKHLNELVKERIDIANRYSSGINNRAIILPNNIIGSNHVYHQYVIRCDLREDLKRYLLKCGIETQIHYPIPPHLAKCYKYLGHGIGDFPITEKYSETVLSLPLYNGMSEQEQEYIIDKINEYQGDV